MMKLPSHRRTITILALICLLSFGILDAVLAFSFSPLPRDVIPQQYHQTALFAKLEDDGSNSEDDEEDWRAFRAKLVMSEGPPPTASAGVDEDTEDIVVDDSDLDGIGSLFSDASSSTAFTPLDPSQWAYDSGKVIEKGAVILGGVDQDFGFGLRQQYFHKAVILVLDHDENTFTKGIILNRPSDRMMDDDVNEGLKWRVWFGGDVQGLDSLLLEMEIVCLHSLKSKEARDCSVTVMKDIQWTSFSNAKKLVKKGIAAGPEDFWLFAGYAGWGPKQLAGELDRQSWYMVATDSQTLLTELARQSKGVEPRDAGLDVWELLMGMIGKAATADKCSGSFDDLMLKEWSQANLVKFDPLNKEEHPITSLNPLIGGADMSSGTVDKLMNDASQLALSEKITAGSLLRASAQDRSPFLLQKQELHHSLILVTLDDENVSLGCMLNHPASKGVEVPGSKTIPIRYGGDFAIKGQSPLMWLHCNQTLRDSGLGSPVGNKSKGIYQCTQEEAIEAIAYNIANPEDFLVTSGVSVWPKLGGSLANEVKRGVFEVVKDSDVAGIFQTLQGQEILTKDNIDKSIDIANKAWQKGAGSKSSSTDMRGSDGSNTLTVGIGEGFDEVDDSIVFNSDKKVSELADDAHKKWIATFLLGSPTLNV